MDRKMVVRGFVNTGPGSVVFLACNSINCLDQSCNTTLNNLFISSKNTPATLRRCCETIINGIWKVGGCGSLAELAAPIEKMKVHHQHDGLGGSEKSEKRLKGNGDVDNSADRDNLSGSCATQNNGTGVPFPVLAGMVLHN
jgi:hypothetical protein